MVEKNKQTKEGCSSLEQKIKNSLHMFLFSFYHLSSKSFYNKLLLLQEIKMLFFSGH